MRIEKILSSHRSDFSAELICEHCGNKQTLTTGYDDLYYHNEVLPNGIFCKSCKKNRNGKIEPNLTITH